MSVEGFLFFKLTPCGHDYEKIIMSAAYLAFSPPQSNKHTRRRAEDGKCTTTRMSDSSGSMALQHSFCFYYHILSWKPGETVDGAMDYPACMG